MAALAMKPFPAEPTRQQLDEHVATIRATLVEMKAMLRDASAATRLRPDTTRQSWVKIEDVRAAIPPDAVLIDCIGYLEYDFDARAWRKIGRTGAFVIPPAGRGEVRFVDLGDDDELHPVVDASIRAMAPPQDHTPQGHRAAQVAVERDGRAAAKAVLGPLMPHVGDAKRWILSPSALTYYVPWAAMVLEDGSFFAERCALSYLQSGRHVLDRGPAGRPAGTPGPPLILADPDYDIGVDATARGEGPFEPLPGTIAEAKAILPHLEAYAKARPRLLLGAEAREEAVLQADPAPSVLVASTHGFHGRLPDVPFGIKSAMLRCGLAFAGANSRRAGGSQPGVDGVLTGIEVLGLDLRGTDLVVLSACNTSDGDFQTSQGLVGLGLAFQLAGARSVLGTFWDVPVDETTELTTEFFRRLAEGKSKDEALRLAQVRVIGSLRKRYGVAHPYLWASFQLSGETRPQPR